MSSREHMVKISVTFKPIPLHDHKIKDRRVQLFRSYRRAVRIKPWNENLKFSQSIIQVILGLDIECFSSFEVCLF